MIWVSFESSRPDLVKKRVKSLKSRLLKKKFETQQSSLETFLDDHSNVIEDLSNGFREAHPHIVDAQDGDEDAAHELVKRFLDKNLTSRLAGRLLVQHHLLLRDQVNRGSFSVR